MSVHPIAINHQTGVVEYSAGAGGGSTVSVDSDGTLVVDGDTVEVATDAETASALAAKPSKAFVVGVAAALG